MFFFKNKNQIDQTNYTQEDVAKANFAVFGACCKKSIDTFNNVKAAALELGIDKEVINVGDNFIIASYGVLQTPALVINNKVVASGKLLSVEDAKKLILANYE